MLERLKKANHDFDIFSVEDEEFKTFGRVIKGIDVSELTEESKKIEIPKEGVSYTPSQDLFEKLDAANFIKNELFGGMLSQTGYCWGHNSMLNATEWHSCNEINIALTPLVLLVAHVWDIENEVIDSSKFVAFYLPAGTTVELYSTTLHYCPCQVSDDGFKCVVGLLKETNTANETSSCDKKLVAKNKWLIAHVGNEAKIKQGAVAGITGKNFKVIY